EERVAGTRREDDDPALFEMAHGTAADIRLRYRRHGDGRKHAGVEPQSLEGALKRQRVHHCRQHADIVAGGAVDALGRRLDAAEDVAAADHDADLGAELVYRLYLRGDAVQDPLIETVVALAHERLAGHFQ